MRQKLDIIAVVGLCVTLIGGTTAANVYLAKDKDLQLVEKRLERKIIRDDINFYSRLLKELFSKYRTENCHIMQEPDSTTCSGYKVRLEELWIQYKEKG